MEFMGSYCNDYYNNLFSCEKEWENQPLLIHFTS